MSPAASDARAPGRHRPRSVLVLVGGEPILGFEMLAVTSAFRAAGADRYEVTIRGTTSELSIDLDGMHLEVDPVTDDDLDGADLVVLVGPDSLEPDMSALGPQLLRAHAGGARLMSVCSAAFALAATGLLDGRRATTHWWYTTALQRQYPEIDVRPDVLFVDEGDVLTSAGSAAAIDLAVHVVRGEWGAAVAERVTRSLVIAPVREGGESQYLELPDVSEQGIKQLCDWLRWNLDQDHDVATLASYVSMSPRTFARRFRAEMGTTPHRWLLRERIALARHLLETTELDVEQVAHRSGFGSATSLRPRFRELTGMSPRTYRRTYASVAPT